MSEQWEDAVQKWYQESRTANLEYLDLTESSKPTSSDLAHNISVVYDRVCLSSRVHIKNFKKILEVLESLKAENLRLNQALKNLTTEVVQNRPLTERRVQEIVLQIVAQPKAIEEQALKLSEDLKQKLDRVEQILHKVEAWVGS